MKGKDVYYIYENTLKMQEENEKYIDKFKDQ